VSEKLQAKKTLYPLLSLTAVLVVLVVGMVRAKTINATIYLGAVYVLLLCFGYWRACLAVIPFGAVMMVFFCGITFLLAQELPLTWYAANRVLCICVSIIPGMALPPVLMVRNFGKLKIPRPLTLAMLVTLTFMPLLNLEVKRVREAMKTRGAGSLWNPKIFYRAFLIPFIMRLVNISDTLALSVETRGFTMDSQDYTVYKDVSLTARDIVFAVLLVVLSGLAVIV